MFEIEFLDHVALRVRDMEESARWYEKVLGLKKLQTVEWGPYPIFMVAGQTGIALFPAKTDQPENLPPGDWLKGDHYAFRVDRENFEAAKAHFEEMGLDYEFQDHYYFHSIYFTDPDGHRLELTTEVKQVPGI